MNNERRKSISVIAVIMQHFYFSMQLTIYSFEKIVQEMTSI